MRIEVRLAPGNARLWQRHLVEQLAARPDTAVTISAVSTARPWPRGADMLLWLEALLGRFARERPSDRIAFEELRHHSAEAGMPNLIIDLTGARSEPGEIPCLALLCDGAGLDSGALAAALGEYPPLFETLLADADGERILSRWRPAVETPRQAIGALDMLFGRAAAMLLHEVERLAHGIPAGIAAETLRERSRRPSSAFLLRSIEGRIMARLDRLLGRAPNWYVAARPVSGPAGDLPAIGPEGFRRLPDDGARFYADPFLWQANGETLLFVEEYPFATGKGLISLARIAPDGRIDRPKVVLEADCHLSYPFVFAHDGAMWMIPETSARRTVELYRADPFPDRWTLHSVLIENADLADATIEKIGERWWMFAASRERWTSSWDALSLFSAPSPFGPWEPHPGNPVLVDLRSARPAGRILRRGDRFIRPVQNCAGGYGAALGFASIDELTPSTYRQTVVGEARPWSPNSGLHTYDRLAGIEVIDLFGPRSG